MLITLAGCRLLPFSTEELITIIAQTAVDSGNVYNIDLRNIWESEKKQTEGNMRPSAAVTNPSPILYCNYAYFQQTKQKS